MKRGKNRSVDFIFLFYFLIRVRKGEKIKIKTNSVKRGKHIVVVCRHTKMKLPIQTEEYVPALKGYVTVHQNYFFRSSEIKFILTLFHIIKLTENNHQCQPRFPFCTPSFLLFIIFFFFFKTDFTFFFFCAFFFFFF